MKNSLIGFTFSVLFTTSAGAQQFSKVLEQHFTAFDTSWNQNQKLECANKLSLIAKKFDHEWLGAYYAAYAKVNLTYQEQDAVKKDAYLDEAQVYIDDAVHLLGGDNDETYVLKAMIANSRIGVDPQKRWKQYGQVFDEQLDKAKALNPDNPRIYVLRGISKFYTPKMFGGGKKAALPYFEKAGSLFAQQTTHDVMKPYWGKQTNDYFMAQIKDGKEE